MSLTEVITKLLLPLSDSIVNNDSSRKCSEVSDTQFIQIGTQPVLGDDKSGRAFLQRSVLEDFSDIEPSCFYKSIGSKRRLSHLKELNNLLNNALEKELENNDRLSLFNELKDFSVFATDGSYFEWACHDETFASNKPLNKETGETAERIENHKKIKKSVHHL